MTVSDRLRSGIKRVRNDDPDECAEVDAFRQANHPAGSRPAHPVSRAWYEQNPYNGPGGGLPRWVCRRGGRIVGEQAELPFELKIGHDQQQASWAVDLMVEPKWRLRGVGPALVATLRDHTSVVIVLHPSREGYKTFLRSGFTDVGIVSVYRRPLEARRALKLPRVPALVRRAAWALALLLGLVDGTVALATRLAGLRLVTVDRFDERIDELWAAVADTYPVIAVRDLTALRWRIDQRPDADRLRRYYLVRKNRTLGYVVLRPAMSSGERTFVVVDYLAAPRWVAPLLLATGRAARREGGVALSVRTCNAQADRSLRLAGFLRLFKADSRPIHLVLHCNDEPDICGMLNTLDNWFLTAADGDVEGAVRVE